MNRMFCTLLAGCSLAAAAFGAEIVGNGQAKACIVLAPDAGPVEKHAAQELALFVKKQTGAGLAIGTNAVSGMNAIRIGTANAKNIKKSASLNSALKKVKDDGFVIDSGKNYVQITANQKRGLLYGVYRILTDHGGILWLFPGDYGEIIPKKSSFAVPEMCKTYNPAFSERKFRLNGGSGWTPETYDWLMRNGLQVFTNIHANKTQKEYMAARDAIFSDGDGGLVPIMVNGNGEKKWGELYKTHPEYFGLRNGKYAKPMECQPCTSNPAVLALMWKHTDERLSKYPADRNVTWCLSNDDHTNWCECANCKKLYDAADERSNTRSTPWWHLVNYLVPRILGKYKNVHIEAFAYQDFRFPPAHLAPDKRAAVMICPHGRCYVHSLDDSSCPVNATKFKEMFDSWHRKGLGGTTFEYHPEMPGKVHYLFHEKSWVKDLQYYHKIGMYGFGMVVTAPTDFYKYHSYGKKHFYSLRNSWEAHWQRYFLTGYYSWNIDADYNAIYEKINSAWYGKTWPVMKQYRQELINALYDSRVHMGYGTPTAVLGKCYERPGLEARINSLLDQASALAKGDKTLEKRIARDREFFHADWVAAFREYSKSKQKEYNARKRTGSIVIDGNLNEMDWKETAFGTDFNVFDEKNDVKADPQTFVRILYDRDNLYFGVEALKVPGTKTVPAKKDGLRALDGSHIEIFLTPNTWAGKYYQLGFSVDGKLYQALTTGGASRVFTMNVNPQFKCVEKADRWILEAKVPLKAMGVKISDGSVWRVNIARAAVTAKGIQSSSWSTHGVFHGSDVHRSVAFGSKGAILRNGDAEDLVKAPAPNPKRKRNWEFAGGFVPKYWSFNENNTGKLEIRKDSPASGKNYVRIQGVYCFTDLSLNEPDKKPVRYAITLLARGKGELYTSIRTNGKYSVAKNSSIKPVSAEKWQKYALVIDAPANPSRDYCRVLALRVNGTIDVDDIKVEVIPEEEIPDAEKHR